MYKVGKDRMIRGHLVGVRIDDVLRTVAHAHCEYKVMDDAYLGLLAFSDIARDMNGNKLIVGDEYMIVTAKNGYPYYVNVTGNSEMAICAEVFKEMQFKL